MMEHSVAARLMRKNLNFRAERPRIHQFLDDPPPWMTVSIFSSWLGGGWGRGRGGLAVRRAKRLTRDIAAAAACMCGMRGRMRSSWMSKRALRQGGRGRARG